MKRNRNVFLLGFTSFFTDISSEMIYPLLQSFISMVFTSQKMLLGPVIGIIEGLAESTASLSKVFVGYYSDRIRSRKNFAISGYTVSAGAKALLLLASLGWGVVLLSRFLERIGKGIRTAPRDALISESVHEKNQGWAFGLHRAMDFAGAFTGVAFCYFVSLEYLDPVTNNLHNLDAFYLLFVYSLIPATIGILFLFYLREPRDGDQHAPRAKPDFNLGKYPRELRYFFIALFIFTLGNSSNQFLLLRSIDNGFSLSTVILMYLVFNLSTSVFSTLFGSLSDRIGARKVLIGGYLVYALVYSAFGLITSESPAWLLWIFWSLYGLYAAMTEGVEKAFVSRNAPANSKATALGMFYTLNGIGLLPASIFAGILFSFYPPAPFLFGGLTALIATVILSRLDKK